MLMNRRYFRSSIHELETLFENRKDDGSVLKALQDELAYRKTERAAKLRGRVVMRLTQLGICTSASTLQQHSLPFEGVPNIKSDPIVEAYAGTLAVLQKSADHPDPTSTALRARVKNHSQRAIPPLTNAPESILSAWTALEVLSPQTFRKPEELASGDRSLTRIDTAELPWERGEKSRPNRRLYYQIVLGAIRMEPAMELLVERYGDTRIEKLSAPSNAALAVVIVDQQGRLTDSSAVAVSSFGWGVMAALNGDLDDLALWPKIESQLVANVESILRNRVSEDADSSKPITRDGLTAAYENLIATFELPVEWMQPPEFAIRSYTHFKDPNPPETILLNSFFLADLSLAKVLFANDNPPHNLRRYLGVERPTQTQDLLLDDETLEKAVSPQSTPLARWPGPGRNPLVLLQQAAINIAFSETTPNGVIGINGPPGTGKTTLLRDLVAGIVTQRAQAMVRFENPETAFLPTELKLRVGQAWIHLHELSDSLKGFEIVVASSNNKAVENVSAELPGVDAIAVDAPHLRYFKTISDSIHGRETWGLIAAILGNAQNRYRFKQLFWWEENKDFNSYLRAVTGSLPNTKNTEPPQPTIREEDPPTTRAEALKRWEIARERFRRALDESRRWQQLLKSLRDDVIDIPRLAKADETATRQYSEVVRRVKRLYQQYQCLTRDLQSASEELRIHA
jgi:energy-coupling factor transporter ATP-binding protein EcfA2